MEVALVILGAVLALAAQFAVELWKASRRKKVVLIALEEELHAVDFKPPAKTFGGFTSKTFDGLFPDVATLLPPKTARRVIRYHLRMKHLGSGEWLLRHPRGVEFVEEVEEMRDDLLAEIEAMQPKRIRMKRVQGAAGDG